MANIVHKGDVGHVFEITIEDDGVARNISGQTALAIYLTKPNKDILTKVASLTNTGTDGKLEYTSIAGDLDRPGPWTIQAKVTEGASPIFHTEEGTFDVRDTP